MCPQKCTRNEQTCEHVYVSAHERVCRSIRVCQSIRLFACWCFYKLGTCCWTSRQSCKSESKRTYLQMPGPICILYIFLRMLMHWSVVTNTDACRCQLYSFTMFCLLPAVVHILASANAHHYIHVYTYTPEVCVCMWSAYVVHGRPLTEMCL